MTPDELLHAILLAPVDLFYNGGIGTYIKASSETQEQVKDRANDAIRVDGNQLRCKVVAEGGNLGATQAGRVEFAQRGGRIFTDAIDNSAGVDCSDHEVNVKIWLDTEVRAGKLSEADRNRQLTEITPDIEALVLRDNALQTHLLTRETQAQDTATAQDGYAALIAALEAEGALSRRLEQLPNAAELAARKEQGRGLTAPELAVVIAHVKNRYKSILAELPLVSRPWARSLLAPYFPALLVAGRDPLAHPLANPILATVLANEAVNRCGPLLIAEMAATRGVGEAEVICAWAQAWAALNLAPLFAVLDRHALRLPLPVAADADRHGRSLQKAVVAGVLSIPEAQLRDCAGLQELTALFARPQAVHELAPGRRAQPGGEGLPADFVEAMAAIEAIEDIADFLFAGLSVPRPDGMSLPQFLQLGMALRREAGIDGLERVLTRSAANPAQQPLRDHALQALRRAQQRLLLRLLHQVPAGGKGAGDPARMVAALMRKLKVGARAAAGDDAAGLEHAVLDVWALSDAASSVADAG